MRNKHWEVPILIGSPTLMGSDRVCFLLIYQCEVYFDAASVPITATWIRTYSNGNPVSYAKLPKNIHLQLKEYARVSDQIPTWGPIKMIYRRDYGNWREDTYETWGAYYGPNLNGLTIRCFW